MRSIKARGERTRGRGVRKQKRTVWLLSTPACSQVDHAMQQVNNIKRSATLVLIKITKML